jgi:uncharacterized protein (DUF1499 family)
MTASDAAQPPTLGMKSERFRPCPDRPNCVSSEAEGPSARVEPLRFTGTPVAAWERLKAAVGAVGGRVEEEGEHYLRATFTSRVFRFVDDLECRLVPDAGIIHVRSASRVGFWDLGVNRRRVEALRQAFHSEPSGRP